VRAGLNLNSNDLSAAVGRVQLRKLEASVRVRSTPTVGAEVGAKLQPFVAVVCSCIPA
jgi:hypothetical protein